MEIKYNFNKTQAESSKESTVPKANFNILSFLQSLVYQPLNNDLEKKEEIVYFILEDLWSWWNQFCRRDNLFPLFQYHLASHCLIFRKSNHSICIRCLWWPSVLKHQSLQCRWEQINKIENIVPVELSFFDSNKASALLRVDFGIINHQKIWTLVCFCFPVNSSCTSWKMAFFFSQPLVHKEWDIVSF